MKEIWSLFVIFVISSHGVSGWLFLSLGVSVPVLRSRVTVNCVTVYVLPNVWGLDRLGLRLVERIQPWLNYVDDFLRPGHEADCA